MKIFVLTSNVLFCCVVHEEGKTDERQRFNAKRVYCTFYGCLPSSPDPISPIPILPNFSSHFAIYRLDPTHFAPLPPRLIIFSPTYHFALLPIHPLPIRQMPSRPFTILPHHRFAQCQFCPFIISPLYHFITLFQFH